MAGDDEDLKVRWWLLGASVVGGGGLIGFAVYADTVLGWDDIRPSVALEVGAAIALAGLLTLFERRFLRRVNRQTREALEPVQQQAAALQERIAATEARLESLTDLAEARRRERHEAEDTAVTGARERPSFETVMRALAAADDVDATGYVFQARAAAADDAPRMRLEPSTAQYPTGEIERLLVLSLRSATYRGALPQVDWTEGEAIEDVLGAVLTELDRANVDGSKSTFDPTLAFANFLDGLHLAVRARRGDLPRRLIGRVLEVFDDNLVITEAGIESILDGLLVPTKAFPDRMLLPGVRGKPVEPWTPPPRPVDMDPDRWEAVVTIAKSLLPPPPIRNIFR